MSTNHRGIYLLSIADKILAGILLNRLIQHFEQCLLPESQCGFRSERETTNMIFAARQLQEKCQEQHSDLFVTLVDLTKACDKASRNGIWKIMETFGSPSKFITIVRQFHGASFPVTNDVKRGCVLSPTLFSMASSALLTDAFVTAGAESDTGLTTAGSSTSSAWRLLQSWRRPSSETSCLLTTVASTPAKSRWCSMIWTTHLKAVTTSALSPAPKRSK